jgi:uncharacterized Zn finger protein
MSIDRAETIARLRRVTWEAIEGWAGSTIAKRGQGYHRNGRVKELAYTADDALLAWVHGSVRYATLEVAAYLRKLGRLLERQKRADEWRRYVIGLREANKRKRRFVEEIDKLVR